MVLEGFADFSRGRCEDAGFDLFVDHHGVVRRIRDFDLNGDGHFDLVLPNSHGNIERGPVAIFRFTGLGSKDGPLADAAGATQLDWVPDNSTRIGVVPAGNEDLNAEINGETVFPPAMRSAAAVEQRLAHDSGWCALVRDIDADGYPDLLVCTAENGISSELNSYIYWGGPEGLTGEYTELPTSGAYKAELYDLTGNGLFDILFTSAWYDHHNPGVDRGQTIYLQTAPRVFEPQPIESTPTAIAATGVLCADLNNDGYPELVYTSLRRGMDGATEAVIYYGRPVEKLSVEEEKSAIIIGRLAFPREPFRLPTNFSHQVKAFDYKGDGYPDLYVGCQNYIRIFHNDRGSFRPDNYTDIATQGVSGQFMFGTLAFTFADVDYDGRAEFLIATDHGLEVRRPEDPTHLVTTIGSEAYSSVSVMRGGADDAIYIFTTEMTSPISYDTESPLYRIDRRSGATELVMYLPTHGAVNSTWGDLDGDGCPELIVCNTLSGPSQRNPEFPIFVYPSVMKGERMTFPASERRKYPVLFTCHSNTIADLDNDGVNEMAVTNRSGWRLFDTPNARPGDWPAPELHTDFPHGGDLMSGAISVADFNKDGWLDIIDIPWVDDDRPETLANSATVWYGGPDGFSPDRRQVLPCFVRVSPSCMLADIDGDGYLDFIYGHGNGHVGILYGGPEGFDLDRNEVIPLSNVDGALIFGITAGDIDGDGELELIVASGGHYTRRKSHVWILRRRDGVYPLEEQTQFETGGTTGFPALADMYGTGRLDLILPFYSTTTTRELPLRIFRNNGQGDFDWDNPEYVDCPASIGSLPIDLNGNGYPDLFICCHRNDLGHIVHSQLLYNSPSGLDRENIQYMLGYGPHDFTLLQPGNVRDKSIYEYYTSPPLSLPSPADREGKFTWDGATPFSTTLDFSFRYLSSAPGADDTADDVDVAAVLTNWTEWRSGTESVDEAGEVNGGEIALTDIPATAQGVQFRARFGSPRFVGSAALRKVKIL
ncbi:MAG: VCBS repeat-containing protein [Clostridiaceae bacterium]|nr:VCBS repeat-containing protein [Clostridiaceae bacterium]